MKDLFKPHFDFGINTKTLKAMVDDKSMVDKVESHIAMSASPYTSANTKDPEWIKAVREGKAGCAVRDDWKPGFVHA